MPIFTPRTFPQIQGEMNARLIALTPLTDLNFGSVWTTMLEAAAQEDDEQYFQMLSIIRGFSLDTTTGDDLDDRAAEYGLERLPAGSATSVVTLGDSSITKIVTGIYSGTSGPAAGATSINGDSATGFSTSGSIVIGRGTLNAETKPYSSISVFANFVTFNLSFPSALGFDHGTDESIILAQGGDRLIPSGAVVFVPASDISAKIDFATTAAATILDGESALTGVPVAATAVGAASNVPVGAIQRFDSLPFPTATVTNPQRVTNGRDIETDQELRDRIKDTIQSLSRGTGQAIITGVLGVVSNEENKRVISASIIEPTVPADVVKLFIDDGTGFIPTFSNVGFEELVASATGGEKFLSSSNVPIVKAFVETQSQEPFNLVGGESLFVDVGGFVETVIFESADFSAPGAATAQEVLARINAVASLFEGRVSSGGPKVRIFSRTNTQEEIQVTGGTANTVLNFPTDKKFTTKLFQERNFQITLLSKDGRTASIEVGNAENFDFSGATHNTQIVIDGRVNNPLNLFTKPADFVSAANATSEEMCSLFTARVPGVSCVVSSNNTKFRLNSLTQRSSNSKIRVVNTYEQVWNEEGGSPFIDRTTEAAAAGLISGFAADLDFLYLGHSEVPFNVISVDLSAAASANIGAVYEQWNGSIWQVIGVIDDTLGWQQSGLITLPSNPNWVPVVVNGSAAMYFIRVQRNNAGAITGPSISEITVSSTHSILGFSETEVVGVNKDYTVNRFIGQIELENPADPLDRLTLGSLDTRASLVSAQGNYNLVGGEAFNIEIDGVLQTFSFVIGDFFAPGTALPSEVIVVLNRELAGITATTEDSGSRVRITTNKMNGGSLKVNTSASNVFLQFSEVQVDNLDAHLGATESGSAEPYSFVASDSIIAVIDGNLANNFTIPCYYGGVLTGVTDPSTLIDTALNPIFPLDTDLVAYEIEMVSGSNSGIRRIVGTYTAATGTLVTTAPFPNTAGVAEITNITETIAGAGYDVVGAAKHWFLNSAEDATLYYIWYNVTDGANTQTDPGIGGRTGIQVDILLLETSAQIAVKAAAAISALPAFGVPVPGGATYTITNAATGATTNAVDVNASVTVLVTTPGVDDAQVNIGDSYQVLPVNAAQVVALWNNSLVTTVTSVAEILTSSSGTKVQIASLAAGENGSARVTGGSGNAVLNFPITIAAGIDGYRYFTGLMQEVQTTIDGVDGDDTKQGIRAAGVQVEVIEPIKIPITVGVTVTPSSGITLAAITNEIKTAVSNYINTLPVGGDVIESDITTAIKAVGGVFDIQVTNLQPKAISEVNVPIADSELARINEANIIVG